MMNHSLIYMSLLLILNINILGVQTSNDNNVTIEQLETSNINSKRLWFNVTNQSFLKDKTHLEIEWKNDSIFSESATSHLNEIKNYNGGIYYYIDVPIKCESIRIHSKNREGIVVASTKWKTNLYPARLYEVFGNSDILRFRSADVYPPDAYVFSAFISNYYSCSSSYENGYSAYLDIEKYWLSNYAGNVNGSLDTTFFYDYPYIQESNQQLTKSRLISAKEKVNELKYLYNRRPVQKRNADIKVLFIGLALFILTLGISFVVCFFVLKFSRNKGGATYDFK